MNTNEEHLNNLTNHEEFSKLVYLSSPSAFNIFEVLDDAIGEVCVTRILKFFFDSQENHNLGNKFGKEWLQRTPHKISLSRGSKIKTTFNWSTPSGRFLDLLLEIYSSKGALIQIVGLEIKITAEESKNQVSDYQDALISEFPKTPQIIIFLTPDGRESKTCKKTKKCPCIMARFDSFIPVLTTILKDAHPDVAKILEHLMVYLEQNTRYGDQMARKIEALKKLEMDPSTMKAIELIREDWRPTIRTLVYEHLLPACRDKTKKDVSVAWHYPNKSRPNEFNFIYPEIMTENSQTESAFYYMLHSNNKNPDKNAHVKFQLMYCKHKNPTKETEEEIRLLKEALMPTSNGKNFQWGPWICLWTSNEIILEDLGTKDSKKLADMFLNTTNSTEQTLLKWIKENMPKKSVTK